jgi:hypothetical protein
MSFRNSHVTCYFDNLQVYIYVLFNAAVKISIYVTYMTSSDRIIGE